MLMGTGGYWEGMDGILEILGGDTGILGVLGEVDGILEGTGSSWMGCCKGMTGILRGSRMGYWDGLNGMLGRDEWDTGE